MCTNHYKAGTTSLYEVGSTICNDVVHLHSLAYSCGNHGKSSQCAGLYRLGARQGRTLIRFVCANCSATGQFSSRGLFLSRVAVHRHIAASNPCSTAKIGIREIQVDVRTSDVMARAGGAAGPVPDVRHQPAGTVQCCVGFNGYTSFFFLVYHHGMHAGSAAVKRA